MSSTRHSCHISIKLKFSVQIFEKYSNVIRHGNLLSGSQVVPWGQTDRHDETNIALRNLANASKICISLEIYRLL